MRCLLHRSQPDTVTNGHILFWLHQAKAVSAEVKLRELCVLAAQLQVKVSQQENHKSAGRKKGGFRLRTARGRAQEGEDSSELSGAEWLCLWRSFLHHVRARVWFPSSPACGITCVSNPTPTALGES